MKTHLSSVAILYTDIEDPNAFDRVLAELKRLGISVQESTQISGFIYVTAKDSMNLLDLDILRKLPEVTQVLGENDGECYEHKPLE